MQLAVSLEFKELLLGEPDSLMVFFFSMIASQIRPQSGTGTFPPGESWRSEEDCQGMSHFVFSLIIFILSYPFALPAPPV